MQTELQHEQSTTDQRTDREHVSRRRLLGAGVAAVTATVLFQTPALARLPLPRAKAHRQRSIRLAHLTDLHIQPEKRAYEGVEACLRHVYSGKDTPELVLTGGDLVYDTLAVDRSRLETQWNLFSKVMRNECRAAETGGVRHCLGNHDCWGWNKKKSNTSGSEAGWGKQFALDLLGLSKPYHSFNKAGWHFIVLDSVRPEGEAGAYKGGLDDEQFEWLKGDLASTPSTMPTLVLTHIPIVCAGALIDTDPRPDGILLTAGKTFQDARRVTALFRKHPNVKLVLSGHIHIDERIEYMGVTHLCNGAVSGNWWSGNPNPPSNDKPQRAVEGYAILDLYDDGSFEREYRAYGWVAAK